MTEDTTDEPDTMGAVDHTHPHRNTTFGSVFGRGPAVAADGGETVGDRRSSSKRCSDGGEPAADGERPADADDDLAAADEMTDVSHTPPHGDGANDVFERGDEGRVGVHDE